VDALDVPTAFISTPSLYFSVAKSVRAKSKVFDLDPRWFKDPGFVHYDFREPLKIPAELQHSFDLVVVDPPFVTRDAWEKYAETVKFVLRPGGKIILTTLAESKDMMAEILGVRPNVFKPSIPHLVYQYDLYSNFDSPRFAISNPEIPE
jgi:hypothetical protein